MRFGVAGSLICSLLVAVALLLTQGAFSLTTTGRAASSETIGYGLRPGGCKMASYTINPFAIYGSPVGIFMGGMNVQASNQSEHMGIPVTPVAPYATIPGDFLAKLYDAQSPKEHFHVTEALARTDLTKGQRLQLENAKRLVDQKLRFAYLLDPTNPQVLQPLIWREGEMHLNYSTDDLLALINHTMAAYHTQSGLWPEHNIYSANAMLTKWNLLRNPSGQAMEDLLTDISGRLELAKKQKDALVASGAWGRRREFQKKDYDEGAFYLGNFRQQLSEAVDRQRAASGKK